MLLVTNFASFLCTKNGVSFVSVLPWEFLWQCTLYSTVFLKKLFDRFSLEELLWQCIYKKNFCDSLFLINFCDGVFLINFCDGVFLINFCDGVFLINFCDSVFLINFFDSVFLINFCASVFLINFCDSVFLIKFCDSVFLINFCDSVFLIKFCDSVFLIKFCDNKKTIGFFKFRNRKRHLMIINIFVFTRKDNIWLTNLYTHIVSKMYTVYSQFDRILFNRKFVFTNPKSTYEVK